MGIIVKTITKNSQFSDPLMGFFPIHREDNTNGEIRAFFYFFFDKIKSKSKKRKKKIQKRKKK
jgi:hypothetical protein